MKVDIFPFILSLKRKHSIEVESEADIKESKRMIVLNEKEVLGTLKSEMSSLVTTWTSDMNKHTPSLWKHDKV